MYDFLDKLRAKPAEQRKHIAFLASTGITGVIAMVWMSVVLTSPNLTVKPLEGADQQANVFNTMFNSEGAASIIEVLDKASEVIEEVKNIEPPRPDGVTSDESVTDPWSQEYDTSVPDMIGDMQEEEMTTVPERNNPYGVKTEVTTTGTKASTQNKSFYADKPKRDY